MIDDRSGMFERWGDLFLVLGVGAGPWVLAAVVWWCVS